MNIKQLLIHLLGGVTKQEMLANGNKEFFMGKHIACMDVKAYAESLNGTPADDWCKAVYNLICVATDDAEQKFQDADREIAVLSEAPVPEGSPEGSLRNWPLPPMETAPKAPAKRWIPKSGETYHYINLSAEMWCVKERVDEGSFLDYCAYDNNNCFKTAELAALALADIRDVLKFAKKE